MHNRTEHGFTLIELLVVIAIIGILAGMVLVSMNGARSKARDARRLSDMRQMISAQEMYYGMGGSGDAYLQSAAMPTAISTYLATVPLDPTNSGNYVYKTLDNSAGGSTPNPQFYCYYAQLENAVSGHGTTTFYTASQGGNFYRSTAPTTFGKSACTNSGCTTTQAAAATTDCSASN